MNTSKYKPNTIGIVLYVILLFVMPGVYAESTMVNSGHANQSSSKIITEIPSVNNKRTKQVNRPAGHFERKSNVIQPEKPFLGDLDGLSNIDNAMKGIASLKGLQALQSFSNMGKPFNLDHLKVIDGLNKALAPLCRFGCFPSAEDSGVSARVLEKNINQE